MSFEDWLARLHDLNDRYTQALRLLQTELDAEPPTEDDDPDDDTYEDDEDIVTPAETAWWAVQEEAAGLLEELEHNWACWEREIAAFRAALTAEALQEQAPPPLRTDLVGLLHTPLWRGRPPAAMPESFAEWLDALHEIGAAMEAAQQLGLRVHGNASPRWLMTYLEAHADDWHDDITSHAPVFERDFLELFPYDAQVAFCQALISIAAPLLPSGSIQPAIILRGLPKGYGMRPAGPEIDGLRKHAASQIPVQDFDWAAADIESAWYEFCDAWGMDMEGWADSLPEMVTLADEGLLGPARYAVCYAGLDHASGYLFFDVYGGEPPPWLNDLLQHMLSRGHAAAVREEAVFWIHGISLTGSGCSGDMRKLEAIAEQAEQTLRKERISGADGAKAYVEEQVGVDLLKRLSNKTRQCLVSAAMAYQHPERLSLGTAVSALWLAVESEWKCQLQRYRSLRGDETHEQVSDLALPREIIDGPHNRLVLDFQSIRPQHTLRHPLMRSLLRKLRSLRNAHEHEAQALPAERLTEVLRPLWEEDLLRKYLIELLPPTKG